MATYDSLVTNTPIWLYAQNKDIVAQMPDLIADAEDQIFELIDHDLFQETLTGKTILQGQPDLDLTSDLIQEIRAIRISYRGAYSFTPVERRDLEFLTMLYTRNIPDRPRYYGQYGSFDQVRLFPIPRQDYDIEITVNKAPPRLSPSVQTNILIAKYPRVYEKASLKQGAIYMKNPADAATYDTEMVNAIMEANMAIGRHRRDETGTRPLETANSKGK
jgi:hypothetical protein